MHTQVNAAVCSVSWKSTCEHVLLTCRYVGRADAQVKLRGFRLELGEIEAVLAAVPGVQDAVVVLQDAHTPAAVLVAYVTPETADEAALLAAAHAKLPHYMVPSAFVRLAELPRLPSGKVSRKALPRSDAAADETAFVAPRTPAGAGGARRLAADAAHQRASVSVRQLLPDGRQLAAGRRTVLPAACSAGRQGSHPYCVGAGVPDH